MSSKTAPGARQRVTAWIVGFLVARDALSRMPAVSELLGGIGG